jgi:hypothetical protein
VSVLPRTETFNLSAADRLDGDAATRRTDTQKSKRRAVPFTVVDASPATPIVPQKVQAALQRCGRAG